MAIEIRDLDGDAETLSAFVVQHWKTQYVQPDYAGFAADWTPAYFKWQLPDFAAGSNRGIIASYDGTTLVGVIPTEPIAVTLKGRPLMAGHGSWLTVDSTRLRSGVGRLLRAGQRRFLEEIGASFATGFINFGKLPGKGRSFWTAATEGSIVFKKPRQWAQVLNGRKVAAGVWHRIDQLEAIVAGSAGAIRSSSTVPSVRDYRADDASACYAIFTRHMLNFDLAYRWDEARLKHHLGFGEPAHTLVLEKDGSVTGFVGLHILDIFGRNEMRSGFIDVVAPKVLPFKSQLDLFRSALGFMRQRDVDMALVLGPPIHSTATLLAAGFMPMPSSYKLLAVPTKKDFSFAGVKSAYAHFR